MIVSKIFKTAFIISILLIAIGVYMKIMLLPGVMLVFGLTSIVSVVYILAALTEIYASKKFNRTEKIMWTFAFLVGNLVAGLLYWYIARPRIMREYKVLTSMNRS